MNEPANAANIIPAKHSSGFALVLSLTLMSFALLILLATTAFVRVAEKRSQTTVHQLAARQSAQLALQLAIGQLNQQAGPDQRVSARRAIQGTTRHPNWTGIWDSTNTAAAPTWLVSNRNQQDLAPDGPQMQIVGSGSVGLNTAAYVNVPCLMLATSESTGPTSIAWWTCDQGVKASMGRIPMQLKRPSSSSSSSSSSSILTAPQHLQTQLSTSSGLEELFADYDEDHAMTARKLQAAASLGQILTLEAFKDASSHHLHGEPLFHAVAPFSLGVLASVTANIGLMHDLSLFPQVLGQEFAHIIDTAATTATTLARKKTTQARLQHTAHLQGIDETATLSEGQIAQLISPIISNLLLAFTIRSQSPESEHPNFYLRMRFFCELWNPYTSSLKLKKANGEPLDLELELLGLPQVTVRKISNTAHSGPIALQNLLKDPNNPNGAIVIQLKHDPNAVWLPGQSRNWTGIDASSSPGASPYKSTLTRQKRWNASAQTLGGTIGIDTGMPRLPGTIRHTSAGTQHLQIQLYLVDPSDGSRRLLSQLKNIRYEPISTRLAGYANDHKGSTFGYHILLRGPEMSDADSKYYSGRWLYDHDPRNPMPTFPHDWHLDNNPALGSGSAYVPIKDGSSPLPRPLPAAINETDDSIKTVAFSRLLDRSHGTSPAGSSYNKLWQNAPLFELPRQPPLALASLQHLYFHNERPFKVGNSWGAGGSINTSAWFDRYYFSGLVREQNSGMAYDPKLGLPNPHLHLLSRSNNLEIVQSLAKSNPSDLDAASQLAQHILVHNRFNLNSTSVAGWTAQLAGLNYKKWRSIKHADDSKQSAQTSTQQNTCARAFTRFSHSLAETYQAPQTPESHAGESVAPSAFYRRGSRHFDSSQISALAQQLVKRIKQRGRPFFSMQEFLSPQVGSEQSLLEQAIAEAFSQQQRQRWDHSWEIQNTRSPSQQHIDIDHFAPAFLTQADIMAAIGPQLAPRSDTFKIRACAQSYNLHNRPRAFAGIEAILQRTPVVKISSSQHLAKGSTRGFKLISTRWLSQKEL